MIAPKLRHRGRPCRGVSRFKAVNEDGRTLTENLESSFTVGEIDVSAGHAEVVCSPGGVVGTRLVGRRGVAHVNRMQTGQRGSHVGGRPTLSPLRIVRGDDKTHLRRTRGCAHIDDAEAGRSIRHESVTLGDEHTHGISRGVVVADLGGVRRGGHIKNTKPLRVVRDVGASPGGRYVESEPRRWDETDLVWRGRHTHIDHPQP